MPAAILAVEQFLITVGGGARFAVGKAHRLSLVAQNVVMPILKFHLPGKSAVRNAEAVNEDGRIVAVLSEITDFVFPEQVTGVGIGCSRAVFAHIDDDRRGKLSGFKVILAQKTPGAPQQVSIGGYAVNGHIYSCASIRMASLAPSSCQGPTTTSSKQNSP